MKVGIPKESKPFEGRVGLIPPAAAQLVAQGHQVYVQAQAGVASGYADADFKDAGATVVDDAATLYAKADMIVKVKEPTPPEYPLLEKRHTLFSYLHLAANPELARALQQKGLLAVAFETVEVDGRLPLLVPMSEIAGTLAVHIGTTLLHGVHGGRGVMLGGIPGTDRGHVVVLGAGSAGGAAARAAAAMGAQVTVLERNPQARERMHLLGANVTARMAYQATLAEALADADLFVGAVLVPGARAPKLVTAEMVRRMRPGSVIVDIAVDQGGCVETTQPTDYRNPTYIKEGVIHFAVTNMPGAVPRTASQALSGAILPYVLRLAANPDDPVLASGVNVRAGRIVHPAVSEALANAA